MAKQIARTDCARQPLAGHSPAVKSGGFVIVAGQGRLKAATGKVHGVWEGEVSVHPEVSKGQLGARGLRYLGPSGMVY